MHAVLRLLGISAALDLHKHKSNQAYLKVRFDCNTWEAHCCNDPSCLLCHIACLQKIKYCACSITALLVWGRAGSALAPTLSCDVAALLEDGWLCVLLFPIYIEKMDMCDHRTIWPVLQGEGKPGIEGCPIA